MMSSVAKRLSRSSSGKDKALLSTGSRILIALGGNALIQPGQKGTYEEVFTNTNTTAKQLAGLVSTGYKLTVTHGNGPQVGAIVLQNAIAKDKVPEMPLYVCGAQTQGYIGWMIQNCLSTQLMEKKVSPPPAVVSLVTQVRVDQGDPSFGKPTKPIGAFYTEAEAKAMKVPVVEDAGRGWRKVVASPKPLEIIERDSILALQGTGAIVIASGGGGIPVVRKEDGSLSPQPAVIDKDLAGSLLAVEVKADALMILTDVDGVYLNYSRTSKGDHVPKATVAEMEKYIEAGHFAPGSMLPKVQACLSFVKKTGKPAFITSLDAAEKTIQGTAGTRITA